ncbi:MULTISPECIES: hypothetical protein [Amycolatopsis]|uniref:hypothetical protein n=1 Tax=Amycolatopsis sp. cg13 TaxID=3238807 RepID=UPI003526065B
MAGEINPGEAEQRAGERSDVTAALNRFDIGVLARHHRQQPSGEQQFEFAPRAEARRGVSARGGSGRSKPLAAGTCWPASLARRGLPPTRNTLEDCVYR